MSVRAVRVSRAGWPSFRIGQLRSTHVRPTRSRRSSRICRKAPSGGRRGPAPRGASSDGPPAPTRLEQPSPSMSPISDAPCRLAGTASPVPVTGCSWHGTWHLAMPRSDAFTRGTKTAPHASPLRMGALAVGTSSVVPRPTGQRPVAAPCALSLTECDTRRHTPFSPWDRRLVRQHDVRNTPWPAPHRPNRLAAPRATRRAMRRTDFCHLTSSYEHPRLVGSWRRKLPFACPGFACFTAERFTSAERLR
jgi:hypothetical protein